MYKVLHPQDTSKSSYPLIILLLNLMAKKAFPMMGDLHTFPMLDSALVYYVCKHMRKTYQNTMYIPLIKAALRAKFFFVTANIIINNQVSVQDG
jgi:hypothetical protein